MKNYKKDYPSVSIGGSDIASLILSGCGEKGFCTHVLHFGGDGEYFAHLVDEECEIPSHYNMEAVFTSWMKIYDDQGVSWRSPQARKIEVYTAGSYGVLIKLIRTEESLVSDKKSAPFELERKIFQIAGESIDEMFNKMYSVTEEHTGLSFAGDISPWDSITLGKLQEDLSEMFLRVAKNNILPKEGTFYKACVAQIKNEKIEGHSILVEPFESADEAAEAALVVCRNYDYPSYQIRAYGSKKDVNIVSFFKKDGDVWKEDAQDTGLIVSTISMRHIYRKEEKDDEFLLES